MTLLGITLARPTYKSLMTLIYQAVAFIFIIMIIGKVTLQPISSEMLSILFIAFFASGLVNEIGISMIEDGWRAATLLLLYIVMLIPIIVVFSKGIIVMIEVTDYLFNIRI